MKTEMMIPPAQRAVVALNSDAVGKELAELVEQSKSITAITNPAGRAECHAAAMRAKNARVGIEKAGKEARDDATAFSKAVIAEVKRLSEIVEPEEERLLAIRDKWDAEREAERQARIEAERQRVAEIQQRITDIRAYPLRTHGMTSAQVDDHLKNLHAIVIDDSFKEFFGDAMNAKEDAIAHLVIIRDTRAAEESEAARIAEEKRIAAEKAEQERIAREAEIKRQSEENERIRLENLAAQHRIDAARAEQEAAAAKLKADQDAFDKRQAAAVEQERMAEAARIEKESEQVRLAQEAAIKSGMVSVETTIIHAAEKIEPTVKESLSVDSATVVVDNQDAVRAFLDSRAWRDDQARNVARAIVMEWEKFKAVRQ